MLLRRQFLARLGLCAMGMPLLVGRRRRARPGRQTPQPPPPLVELAGDPRTVGARFGQLNAHMIRAHMCEVLCKWWERGLSEKEMLQRSRPFRRFAEKFAPHWLEEVEGCAQGAGVSLEHYTAFLAGKYRDLFFTDECTSFFAVGTASDDGATLFHKTRDNVSREQTAYHKKIVHSSKPAGFFATGDTSDTGVMMMVNDRGLAGSADMGGLKEDRPKGRGVANPYILRLIAERAERCEDALKIIQEAIRDGWYAGGKKTGTNWSFADRFGTGLNVAQNSHREEHRFFHNDVFFSARAKTKIARWLLDRKGKITFRDLNRTAWSPEMCFTSSISALTVRIDPANPGELNRVWFALPAWSPCLPVYPLAGGVPRELAGGAYYLAAHALLRRTVNPAKKGGVVFPDPFLVERDRFQEELDTGADQAAAQIAALVGRKQREEAAKTASESSIAACKKVMAFLGQS